MLVDYIEGGEYRLEKKILNASPHNQKTIKYIRKDENTFCGVEVIAEKRLVMEYLTGFYPNLSTTGRVYDNVKKVVVESKIDNGYFDGEYYWDETDIFHLDKYNMPLNPDFIEYVLSK